METLIVLAHHRDQYRSRIKSHGPARSMSFSSRNFRDISRRSFQSEAGRLSPPRGAQSMPAAERATCSYFSSPSTNSSSSPSLSTSSSSSSSSSLRTPSRSFNSHTIDQTTLKNGVRSSPIRISDDISKDEKPFIEEFPIKNVSFSYSELWAGPAYSNSPPPSSLPFPKFSLRQKRTASLDLPTSKPMIEMQPMAKSAPASPTREHNPSARELFLMADSATKTLRRILNLDDAEE